MSGTLRLSILIEAIDRASRPIAALQGRLGRVAAEVLAVGQATQRLASASGATIVAGSFGNLAGRVREASDAVGNLARRLAGGSLLGAGGIYLFNRQFVRGAADFERYRITLETVMGSAEAAQRRLSELVDFAGRTPFNVAEVVRAGVALQTLGIRGAAADRALTAAGDAASVFGTSLQDAMTALSAAGRGELDPIERFGLQARTEGNRIVLEWEENGRRMRATIDKNNRAAIVAATARAWRGIAGGGMQRLAATWDGMLSNLGDAWSNFTRQIAESGPFDFLKDQLRELLAWIERVKQDGTLDRWALETGAAITDAFRSIRDFVIGTEEVPGVLTRLQAVFERVSGVLGPLVRWIGGFETALLVLGLVLGGPVITALVAVTSAMIAFGAALLLTPAGWFLLAAAAIAGIVYLIYENWSGIVAFFRRIWDGVTAAWDRFVSSEQAQTTRALFEAIATGVMAAWEPVGRFFGELWAGITDAFAAAWSFIEPIVNAVAAGAERLAAILPDRGSGRTAGGSGALAPAGQGLRRRIYGDAALGAEGVQGVLPPANDVRVRAGLDVNIRLPEGADASVTQRGADDGLALILRRGMLAVP